MIDAVVYGMGKRAYWFLDWVNKYNSSLNVIGVVDSYSVQEGRFHGKKIFSLSQLVEMNCLIVIAIDCPETVKTVMEKMVVDYRISEKSIVHYFEFVNNVRKNRIIEKYINKQDEYGDIARWLSKGNKLSVRNQYANVQKKAYQVYEDETNHFPYIIFFGKKLFLPKDYYFERDNEGNPVVYNIVEEDQYDNSPHLYMKDGHMFDGGVLVDAGVAEGNFALRYIDLADKVYLIEPEERWLEVLQYTFAPYKEKIELIPKKLGRNCTDDDETTLDNIIGDGKCDFIKMDIEGAEPDALLGAINVIKRNDVKLSICSYHRQFDQKYIEFILQSIGCETSVSSGFMFFLYDELIDFSLDFRRGIVYGKKK